MTIEYDGLSSENTVKADEHGNKYIAMQTGTVYNFLKFKNNENYPKGTYTFAYLVRVDDYKGTGEKIDFNDMSNWSSNGYLSQMTPLSHNTSVVSCKASSPLWMPYRVTASTIDGQNLNYFIALITDTLATKGSTFGLDNIVIYYNAPKRELSPEVTVNPYDYRKGQFDITFSESIGISEKDAHSLFFETTDVFDAACTLTNNVDGSVTYCFYEDKAYKNKSVTLNSVIALKTPDTNLVVSLPEDIAGKTYTFNTLPDDGENLVPNGDAGNPYFVPFTTIENTFKDITVNDGAFRFELRNDLESYTCWNSFFTNEVDFEADTNYYIDIDIDFVKQPDNIKYTAGKYDYINVYIPNTTFTSTDSTYKVRPDYIKGISKKDNFYASTDSFTIDQGNYTMVYKTDAAVTAPNAGFQLDLDNNFSLFLDSKEKGQVKGAGGLAFVVKNYTIKKMYNVNLADADEGIIETRLAAKDVTIYLPDTAPVSGVDTLIGWTDGEKVYAPGGEYTLTKAGDVTLTAVIEGVTPKSFNENSIRLVDPQGIRFKSAVTNVVKKNEKTTEYGYVVTRAGLLGNHSAYDLVIDGDIFCIYGVSYGIDEKLSTTVDRIYDKDDTYTYFTAVVHGIPKSNDNYRENIIVRPYVVYDGEYVYGEPMSRSILSVAEEYKAKGYNGLDEAQKKIITDILDTCGIQA